MKGKVTERKRGRDLSFIDSLPQTAAKGLNWAHPKLEVQTPHPDLHVGDRAHVCGSTTADLQDTLEGSWMGKGADRTGT